VSQPDYQVVIVGAGIVGLAVAARLAGRFGEGVLVIERHDGICRETSSRNSEVVHAGIYYPAGSAKARLCLRGRELLYARCVERAIPHVRSGKLIVASSTKEIAGLEELQAKGEANGVAGLRIIDAGELRRREPGVAGVAALWSPESGYLDSHLYAASFQRDLEAHGGAAVFHTELVGVERVHDGSYRLAVSSGGELHSFTAARVVNAAGLGQDAVSRLAGIDVQEAGYETYPCKGCWWSIAPRHRGRVRALIYPVGRAEDPGLGIHLCLDVGGGMRLGPDSVFVDDASDLVVPFQRERLFLDAGQRLFPWLEANDLSPDMAGMRTKLVSAPKQWRDFVIAEESDRGLPGWVTLAGIESPGLTAAGAIAEQVDALLR